MTDVNPLRTNDDAKMKVDENWTRILFIC